MTLGEVDKEQNVDSENTSISTEACPNQEVLPGVTPIPSLRLGCTTGRFSFVKKTSNGDAAQNGSEDTSANSPVFKFGATTQPAPPVSSTTIRQSTSSGNKNRTISRTPAPHHINQNSCPPEIPCLAVLTLDEPMACGNSPDDLVRYISITLTKEFENKSFEELRFEHDAACRNREFFKAPFPNRLHHKKSPGTTGPGTSVMKFSPLRTTDSSDNCATINERFQCITCMQFYANSDKSLEELRLEDYMGGRKRSLTALIFGFDPPIDQPNISNNEIGRVVIGSTESTTLAEDNAKGSSHIKYCPVESTDEIYNSRSLERIDVKFHCISCMKDYQNKSLEEIRLEDYAARRNGRAIPTATFITTPTPSPTPTLTPTRTHTPTLTPSCTPTSKCDGRSARESINPTFIPPTFAPTAMFNIMTSASPFPGPLPIFATVIGNVFTAPSISTSTNTPTPTPALSRTHTPTLTPSPTPTPKRDGMSARVSINSTFMSAVAPTPIFNTTPSASPYSESLPISATVTSNVFTFPSISTSTNTPTPTPTLSRTQTPTLTPSPTLTPKRDGRWARVKLNSTFMSAVAPTPIVNTTPSAFPYSEPVPISATVIGNVFTSPSISTSTNTPTSTSFLTPVTTSNPTTSVPTPASISTSTATLTTTLEEPERSTGRWARVKLNSTFMSAVAPTPIVNTTPSAFPYSEPVPISATVIGNVFTSPSISTSTNTPTSTSFLTPVTTSNPTTSVPTPASISTSTATLTTTLEEPERSTGRWARVRFNSTFMSAVAPTPIVNTTPSAFPYSEPVPISATVIGNVFTSPSISTSTNTPTSTSFLTPVTTSNPTTSVPTPASISTSTATLTTTLEEPERSTAHLPAASLSPRSISTDIAQLTFHRVHGENVLLSSDRMSAVRVKSFNNGIVFGSRPVSVYEEVRFRVTQMSDRWYGILTFGYTSLDPDSWIQLLPDSLFLWANDMYVIRKSLEVEDVVHFYVNYAGELHYGVNGEEIGELISGVRTSSPLWPVIDLYGPCVEIRFIETTVPFMRTPPRSSLNSVSVSEDSQLEGTRSSAVEDGRTDSPPSRFEPETSVSLVRDVRSFAEAGAASIDYYECGYGYVFTASPFTPGQTIIVQILHTDSESYGSLSIGLTSCNPATLHPEILPDDVQKLLDRPEYWVFEENLAYETIKGDEISLALQTDGKFKVSKRRQDSSTVMHVDPTVTLWGFVHVHGRAKTVRIFKTTLRPRKGMQSYTRIICSSGPDPGTSTDTSFLESGILICNDTTPPPRLTDTECVICCEQSINSVLYKCGHMCMCYECAIKIKRSGSGECPICRTYIMDVIRTFLP